MTRELIIVEALKYHTMGDFFNGSNAAYQSALRRGILDEIHNCITPEGCSHIHYKWTKETVQRESLKYSTRGDFAKGSGGAYAAARTKGILNEVCSHMTNGNKSWTPELLKAEALKYSTRGDFAKGSGGAYATARTKGILNDLCSHMKTKVKWTKKTLQKEALKYDIKGDFAKGSGGAYAAASVLGVLGAICGHMGFIQDTSSDYDTMYLWQVKGTNIFKIGITSWRLHHQRIIQVAKAHNTEYEIFAMVQVKDALAIEKELLNEYTTTPDNNITGDGHTEFRVLNDTEVIEILHYLYQEAVDICSDDFRFDLIGVAA